METKGLELLEEKIRRAAKLIVTLREERAALERRIEERETEIEDLQAKLAEAPEDDLGPELDRLRDERREILTRVDRMLTILDEAAEEAGEQGLLAAVEGME